MLPPALLHRLLAAQQRAAHEQQLLSGREWILVAALVQGMTSLHPLYSWINQKLLGDSPRPGLAPGIRFAAALILAGALVALWSWARHAPFRAALADVVVFVGVEGSLGFLDPHQLVASAVVKTIVLLGLLSTKMVELHLAVRQAAIYALPLRLSSEMAPGEHDLPVAPRVECPEGAGLRLPGSRRHHDLWTVHFALPISVDSAAHTPATVSADAEECCLSLASVSEKTPTPAGLERLLCDGAATALKG